MIKIVLFVLCLFLLSSFVSANIIHVQDSFNRSNENPLNVADNGNTWATISGGGVGLVSNKASESGQNDYSELVVNTSINNTNNVTFILRITSSGTIGYFRLTNTAGSNGVNLYTPSISGLGLYAIQSGGTDKIVAISPSTDYRVEVVNIDLAADTYDVIVDGVLYDNGGSHWDFQNVQSSLTKVVLGTGGSSIGTITWDEINIISSSLLPPPLPVGNFSITAISNWTGGNLSNFSVDINGTIYFDNLTGNITTNIFQNSTNLFNITVFSDTRFNKTYLNVNVSSDLEANLQQTQVNISFEFSTGDLVIITPINLSALDIGEYYNVTVGYEGLFPDAGFVNFSVVSSNNLFHPFNFTLNLTALDNSSFVYVVNETHNIITFLDENSSNPIDNASITVTSPNGIILNLSTNSSGQINFSYILNNSLDFGSYSYFFDKIGYVNISLSDFINESNIPHTRTYNLSRAKLNIFIYDRVTRELLNGTNVSIAFIGLFNETTDTGILIKDNLTIVGGDYLIFASAVGYKTSIRSLTFTNQEEFTLNFYLLNLSTSNAGTLFVSTKDSFFRDVPGAKVDLLEYIPDSLSYVSVDSCVSNVNAQCSFAVELNTKVYYIRATTIIDGTVFIAETSQNGEIFTVDNDIRNLIFFTRSTFSISTSTNLIYSISESFVNNISSISVDFFTSDGTAKEVCVEYFLLNNSDWVSVTGDTYCLFSSNALQNIDVDVTLNRSNTYQARIYVKETFDNILETFDYPNVLSTGSIFDDDFKATIIMIFWIFALAFCLHQKNITLFFFLAIVISWAEVLLFPIFSIAVISVFKTIVCLLSIYVARKKQDFQ